MHQIIEHYRLVPLEQRQRSKGPSALTQKPEFPGLFKGTEQNRSSGTMAWQ